MKKLIIAIAALMAIEASAQEKKPEAEKTYTFSASTIQQWANQLGTLRYVDVAPVLIDMSQQMWQQDNAPKTDTAAVTAPEKKK